VGALAAVLGVFFMPFIHMVTWFPHALKWLSKQKWINDFLIGATAAVVGCILTTIISMNVDSFHKIMFWILFLATLLILIVRPKTPILLLVFTAGFINLLVNLTALNAV
jgi:chromate transport protein ChrA